MELCSVCHSLLLFVCLSVVTAMTDDNVKPQANAVNYGRIGSNYDRDYNGYGAIYDSYGTYSNNKRRGFRQTYGKQVDSGKYGRYMDLYPRNYAGNYGDENNDGIPDDMDRNRDGKPDVVHDQGGYYGNTRTGTTYSQPGYYQSAHKKANTGYQVYGKTGQKTGSPRSYASSNKYDGVYGNTLYH